MSNDSKLIAESTITMITTEGDRAFTAWINGVNRPIITARESFIAGRDSVDITEAVQLREVYAELLAIVKDAERNMSFRDQYDQMIRYQKVIAKAEAGVCKLDRIRGER